MVSDQAESSPEVDAHDQSVANLAIVADRFAAMALAEHWGTLDFAFEGLGQLDVMLSRFLAGGPLTGEFVALSSAYLGETMVRRFGCTWGDTDLWLVLPPPGSKAGSQPADIFRMMGARLGREAAPLQGQVLRQVNAWRAEPE